MRYTRLPRPIEATVNEKRIANAEKYFKRQRDKMPLLAEQIAEEQPEPVQYLLDWDNSFACGWREFRSLAARQWREARRQLAALDATTRRMIEVRWKTSLCPGDPAYLLGMIRHFPAEVATDLAAGKRWYVTAVGDHCHVMLWIPERAPPSKVAGPFEDFFDAMSAHDAFVKSTLQICKT